MKLTITVNDEQAIEKLSTIRNKSKYITQLILNDLSSNTYITKEQVLQIISEYFSRQDTKEKTSYSSTDIEKSIMSVLK